MRSTHERAKWSAESRGPETDERSGRTSAMLATTDGTTSSGISVISRPSGAAASAQPTIPSPFLTDAR